MNERVLEVIGMVVSSGVLGFIFGRNWNEVKEVWKCFRDPGEPYG